MITISEVIRIDLLKPDFPEITDLKDSRNELEIRVCFFCRYPSYIKLFIVSCLDSVWSVKEYESIGAINSVTKLFTSKYAIDKYDPWYKSTDSKLAGC